MTDSENLKKLPIKKNQFITIKVLDQLKESLNQIEPKKIIKNALNLANKQILESNNEKSEALNQSKNKTINSFLFDINNKDKKIDQLRLLSAQKLEDFKIASNLILEKTKKETKEYVSKLERIKKENQMLGKKYYDLKNQYEDTIKKHKTNLSQIEQMKQSEDFLILNKPVFNDFLKQFKSQSPKEIIQEIEKQKEGFNSLTGEYNSTVNKIIFNKKIYDLKIEREEKKIKDVNEQIHKLEDENSLVQQNFGNVVEKLKKEIKNLQGLKEDNDKYRKMLYQLYNRLIGAFSLDKDIHVNRKYLKLKKEDYKPNLLDDNEIFKYITLMIASMNRSTSGQLLRETIAYCNMITRVYLKNKINLKYEPYSTFKDLKDIMEKNEEKIEKLRYNMKEYEKKLKDMIKENKKLNKIINYFYQEKNKNIELKQNIVNSNINIRNSKSLRKSSTNKEKNSRENIPLKNQNSLVNNKVKKYRINSGNPEIRNNYFKSQRKEINLKSSESINNNIKTLKKSSSSIFDFKEKQIPENIDAKLLKNPLYQSIQSMICNKLIDKYYGIEDEKKENKKNNNMSIQNNNKTINDQNIVTYINEFKQLINHTNRLFLYQARMSPKLYNVKNKNFSQIKPKFNKLFRKKNLNKSTGDLLQNYVGSKIISKINGIINNLQYKDKDDDNNNIDFN